jgi:hypothetical protein
MHRHLLRILLAAGLASPCAMVAQTRALSPATIPTKLQQLAARSETIFSGIVTAITPTRPASGRTATVTITFEVENAIRGVKAGQTYSFREWAGLWAAGPRYRIGQRLLLFLYPPSKLGLTSPVSGPSGVLAVDTQGRVLVPPPQGMSGIPPSPNTASTPLRVNDIAISLRRSRED